MIYTPVMAGISISTPSCRRKEKLSMKDLLPLLIFLAFVSGGGCSLAGTWWSKKKKENKDASEQQDRKQQNR